jgi:hypothetical protein
MTTMCMAGTMMPLTGLTDSGTVALSKLAITSRSLVAAEIFPSLPLGGECLKGAICTSCL